ncbi:MAG TPA: phosphoenolpyruvate synthase [Steroidobacteraceae bacterium]|nr:phosphoenolpyruvate synthase [Steroidobacteraceae bacterium]
MAEVGTGYILRFDETGRGDVALVGGKNASLGEMTRNLKAAGIDVPAGFAVTAAGYRSFIAANGLAEVISAALRDYDQGKVPLAQAGMRIRDAFRRADWPAELAAHITRAYALLSSTVGDAKGATDVAVRSSATAEDLPEASFAGQQESFLNIRGARALLEACRNCYASLFTDRAISYRNTQGFDHLEIALSIGVQKMVRSDLAGSGVMFSIDTETGFDRTVLINAAWGLGENVVQGSVDPDEYVVFKPLLTDAALTPIIEKKCGGKESKLLYAEPDSGRPTRNVPTSKAERARFVLSDAEILRLARWGCAIERHYGMPMDMEWAKDGETGALFIVQARPETVRARRKVNTLRSYRVRQKGRKLVSGISVGDAAVSGHVCMLRSAADIGKFVDGSVLVTGTTDPDWVPVMKRAAALVTDHGGRTSHAAIVSRELGLPAIVGTGNATELLHDEQVVTVSCAEGDQGFVYEGAAQIESSDLDVTDIPATRTQVMLNLANPAAALRWWQLPAAGVGLARMEFVVSSQIKVHPMALVRHATLADAEAKRVIEDLTRGYADKTEYFVERLARGLARIAAAQYPRPVIVRTSDFKSNEYANLIGGREFEPHEENPMIGLRGASRYYSPAYREAFALECRALRRLRLELGFRNVIVMIPFCRTPAEADRVLEVMAQNGLERGVDGLQVYVMCEIPSNVILARAFAQRFDGFSIGSNDLTQLTLGVDRDSEQLARLFDEKDEAVKWMIRRVIGEAHAAGAKVGLCGQAPSNDPQFAAFLVECGIDSISVTPDSFVAVKRAVALAETLVRKTTDELTARQA